MTLAPIIDIDDPDEVTGAGLFALLCARRGWDEQYLRAIQSAEHDDLKDVHVMVAALEQARASGHKVVIAPDFDMDGISSGVLGYAGLSELGFDVEMHLPDYRRGHDVGPADVAEIHQHWPDTQVLLTCDGGVNSHEGIGAAKALGWTTLVTDHHAELPPGSSADITVNPCRIDENYTLKGICGAHVLYQVIEAYARTHRPDKIWEIHLLRLFAGLGTVSDVMPLLFENRQMVRDSLSIARLLWTAPPRTVPNRFGGFDLDLNQIDIDDTVLMQLLRADDHHPVYLDTFEGFATLLKTLTRAGKIRDIDDIDEGLYGFYIAPAMNSPRRTSAALKPCFDTFLAPTAQAKLAAAEEVLEGNERRKEMVEHYVEQMLDMDQPWAPWVFVSDAPGGMYGLLANTMMERFAHPVVVLNRPVRLDQPVSGSARAPEWFDVITSLEPHEGLEGIGHQQACGVKVAEASRLNDLVTVLSEATTAAQLAVDGGLGPSGDLVLGIGQQADAPLSNIEPLIDLVRKVEQLRPFGHGFPQMTVEVILDPADMRVERIGSDADCDHERTDADGHTNARGYWVCHHCKKHLRLVTADGLACLWWNAADEQYQPMLRVTGDSVDTEPLRFLGRLQLNTFMDQERVQVVINERISA